MKVLPARKTEEALNILCGSFDVFAPIARGAISNFFQWVDDPDDELVLEAVNTYNAPKNILLPSSSANKGQDVDLAQIRDRIIFGIKPCDLRSLEALDMVFLNSGYVDELYKARREKSIFIARPCYQPGGSCFCESLGVDRLHPNADVLIHDTGRQDMIWEPVTARGQEITELIKNLLVDQEVALPQVQPLKKQVDPEGLAEMFKDKFDDPLWDDISFNCITCGLCTNACPSCHCYDIQATIWGEEGYSFQCWDTCMYQKYPKMVDGHNPSDDKKERFRNRFLHKLQFFPERYGTLLCTGCGRCMVMCPNGINILRVIDKFREAGKA
ncbi:MAG: 4Fe-4S dicluster domain-containing protein [Chitinophagales bacterium]